MGLGQKPHCDTSRVVDILTPLFDTSRVVDTPEVDFQEEIHIINTSGLRKSAIIAMFCRLESYTECQMRAAGDRTGLSGGQGQEV